MKQKHYGHWLVVGKTGMGKTLFAKRFLSGKPLTKVSKIVLTPEGVDPDWKKLQDIVILHNPDDFLELVFNSKNCIVVVDEGAEFIGKLDKHMLKLATRSRHQGHTCFFLAQRANMININIRTQCTNLVLFRSNTYDCDLLQKDLAIEGSMLLEQGPKLQHLEYILVRGLNPPVKKKII